MNYPALIPSLAVHDAAAAIAYYEKVFGAKERFRLSDPTSGKIGHAELEFGGLLFMLADEYPAHNKSPQTLGGTAVKLSLMVDDVDVTVSLAKEHGATEIMEPVDMFYGHRSGSVRDPFGHEWLIQHEIEEVAPEEMQRRWNEMAGKCAES